MADRVELSAPAGTSFLHVGMVTCDVTDPNGTTYRARVAPSPRSIRGLGAALGVLAPQWAVVQYPIGFPRAPLLLRPGIYRVRWELSDPMGFSVLGGRIIHDTFRIER